MTLTVYDRESAVAYAKRWALSRNPQYFDFTEIGGDCTNFVSQCIYAGAKVMNFTPIFGWFYRSASDRTASWTGVEFLYEDFRPLFKEGQEFAREHGFYMQKYCGCVFSEEERYLKAKKIIP